MTDSDEVIRQLMDELKECHRRIDELSEKVDYLTSENSALYEEIDELTHNSI